MEFLSGRIPYTGRRLNGVLRGKSKQNHMGTYRTQKGSDEFFQRLEHSGKLRKIHLTLFYT
jgi:hypothetical protein